MNEWYITKGGPGSGRYPAGSGQPESPKAGRSPKTTENVRGHLDVGKVATHAAEVKQIQKDTGWDDEKAEDVSFAVVAFTGGDYANIRSLQQQGLSKYGDLLEEYINSAPQFDPNATIYRGVRMDLPTHGNIAVGDSIDMSGTSSWSSEKNTAEGFGNVIFETKGVPQSTSLRHLSTHPAEAEVAVSKDVKFKITKITKLQPSRVLGLSRIITLKPVLEEKALSAKEIKQLAKEGKLKVLDIDK